VRVAPGTRALGRLRRLGVPLLVLCIGLASASSAAGASLPGAVVGWGYNAFGQLGDGTTTSSSVPLQVKGVGGVGLLTGVIVVAAGGTHSLALLSNGTVVAWGDNEFGELGNGTTTESPTPVQVRGVGDSGVLSGVKAIAAGAGQSLALLSNGAVVAWGKNGDGELGDGTTTSRSAPVQVVGVGGSGVLSNVAAVAAGGEYSLALLNNGTVAAWGLNALGELGNGTTMSSSTPVQVVGVGGSGVLSNVAAIAAGADHSLALLNSGTVAAWGLNAYGQLGDGTTTQPDAPVLVTAIGGAGVLSGVSAVATGGEYSLALVDGAVAAWGFSENGQLGSPPSAPGYRTSPGLVPGIGGVRAIGAGYAESLTLLSNGGLQAWGDDTEGQLGDGGPIPGPMANPAAVPVLGVAFSGALEGVSALAAGSNADHVLAIQPAFAALSPGTLTFAAHVGSSSAAQAASVTNNGAGPLVISGDSLSGSGAFHRVGGSCVGATLAAGASCAITFVFNPTSTGNAHATVAIQSSAANALPSLNLAGDGVAVGMPLPPLPKPRLSPLKLTPTGFKAAASGPNTVAAYAKRRPGTLISYTDSEAATTTFIIKRCVASAKQSPHKAGACARYRTVGRFTHADSAGVNRLRFTGRINHHKLSAGSYRLLATASTRTETSATRTATFTIKH
jgi:alpha-tubulin suppressor-like RCC1 family protein